MTIRVGLYLQRRLETLLVLDVRGQLDVGPSRPGDVA